MSLLHHRAARASIRRGHAGLKRRGASRFVKSQSWHHRSRLMRNDIRHYIEQHRAVAVIEIIASHLFLALSRHSGAA